MDCYFRSCISHSKQLEQETGFLSPYRVFYGKSNFLRPNNIIEELTREGAIYRFRYTTVQLKNGYDRARIKEFVETKYAQSSASMWTIFQIGKYYIAAFTSEKDFLLFKLLGIFDD